MKKVIIIGGRNITLTGLKKEIEVIDRGFHELTHINSYQKELTGIIGISENSSTFMTLFSLNQPKEGWKERRDIIYSELPDTIDLFTFRGIVKPIINEYFNTYVSIRDSRRTPEADTQRIEQNKPLYYRLLLSAYITPIITNKLLFFILLTFKQVFIIFTSH